MRARSRRHILVRVATPELVGAVGVWTHPLGLVRRESGVRLIVRLGEAARTLSRAVANARHGSITLADSDADYQHRQRAEGRSS